MAEGMHGKLSSTGCNECTCARCAKSHAAMWAAPGGAVDAVLLSMWKQCDFTEVLLLSASSGAENAWLNAGLPVGGLTGELG